MFMFKMRGVRFSLICGALIALPFSAAAQTTSSTTTTGTTTTTVPANKLIEKYTPLAGSEANATKLVTGLRDGSAQITLTSTSGTTTTTTTIDNPLAGKKMGYGNINIVLALAEKQLSMTSSTDLNSVLTNPDNGILTLRASGMGWGQIANSLGFKLGDVMRAAAANNAPGAAKAERAQTQRMAQGSRSESGRPEIQRADRPEKIERPQRIERPEMPQRPERAGR